jgi:inner membrane transporter RhtA
MVVHVGVVALTEPWRGNIAPGGIAFAACAAVGWGSYIVLTQRVGDRFTGLGPLSITVAIGAATAATVGIPQARGHITVEVLRTAIGLALLHQTPGLPPALGVACVVLAGAGAQRGGRRQRPANP